MNCINQTIERLKASECWFYRRNVEVRFSGKMKTHEASWLFTWFCVFVTFEAIFNQTQGNYPLAACSLKQACLLLDDAFTGRSIEFIRKKLFTKADTKSLRRFCSTTEKKCFFGILAWSGFSWTEFTPTIDVYALQLTVLHNLMCEFTRW